MDDGENRQDPGSPRPDPDPAEPGRTPTRSGRTPARAGRGSTRTRRPAQPVAPPVPPPPMDEATAAALARLITTFVLLVLAGFATTNLPLPWRLASLAFTIAAIAVGIRALAVTRRAKAREELSLVLMFGIAFAVLTGMSMAGTVIFWPAVMAHQECLSRAVTIAATDQCESAYEDAVQSRLDSLMRRP